MEESCYIEKTEKYADDLFHCHEQELHPNEMVVAHLHDWVEILYCNKGKHEVVLGNTVLPFYPGSLVVIPINESHHIEAADDITGRYSVLKFSSELLLNIVDETDYDLLRPFMLMLKPENCLFSPEQLQGSNIAQITEQMIIEYSEKKYGYRLKLRALMYLLITFIARAWQSEKVGVEQQRQSPPAIHSKRIFECLQYIQKNYTQPLTLQMFARRCHVSYCYFSRQFSVVTGSSFVEYLSDVRVNAAEHLLVMTDLSITDIAFQVGFSDASYFTRRFSIKTGMTPNQYRKKFSSMRQGKTLIDATVEK